MKTIESPDLTMVQCYILSFIYLLNASLPGTAQIVLASAIRMSYTLGLNQEPPELLPDTQKELRRRIWWTLYLCDTQMCIDQGQPWFIKKSLSLCHLPDDSSGVAQSTGPNFFSPSPDITWLSFHKQAIKLVSTVRAIQTAYYENYNKVISTTDTNDFYNNGQTREECAHFLAKHIKKLSSWVTQLPEEYRIRRRSQGESFSTDRSALDLDPTTPLWLQRQRLLLELQYHNLAMILYRPFICFSANPASSTPLTDNSSISCLSHAIAITNIMYQVLTETDVLNGWYAAFEWQQNAMFVLGGFACAFPVCPPTPSARKALLVAIAVLDIYGNSLAAARHAAELARALKSHVEVSINNFRASLTGLGTQPLADSQEPSSQAAAAGTLSLNTSGVPSPSAANMLDGTFESVESLEPNTAETDAESFGWISSNIMSMDNNDIRSGYFTNFNYSSSDIVDAFPETFSR